jgi:hypothetical protein
MPISHSVVDLLDGRLRPDQAVAALMGRGPTARACKRLKSAFFDARSDVGQCLFHLVHQNQAQLTRRQFVHRGVDGQEFTLDFA